MSIREVSGWHCHRAAHREVATLRSCFDSCSSLGQVRPAMYRSVRQNPTAQQPRRTGGQGYGPALHDHELFPADAERPAGPLLPGPGSASGPRPRQREPDEAGRPGLGLAGTAQRAVQLDGCGLPRNPRALRRGRLHRDPRRGGVAVSGGPCSVGRIRHVVVVAAGPLRAGDGHVPRLPALLEGRDPVSSRRPPGLLAQEKAPWGTSLRPWTAPASCNWPG